MDRIKIYKLDGGKIAVSSPYSKAFINQARSLGGSWDKMHRAWTFDPSLEERVRSLCILVYGDDGEGVETFFTVRIDLEAAFPTGAIRSSDFRVANRQILGRRQSDWKVKLFENAKAIQGQFERTSGSERFPEIGTVAGIVLEIPEVPSSVALKMKEELPEAVEIVGDESNSVSLLKTVAGLRQFREAVRTALSNGVETSELLDAIEEEIKFYAGVIEDPMKSAAKPTPGPMKSTPDDEDKFDEIPF